MTGAEALPQPAPPSRACAASPTSPICAPWIDSGSDKASEDPYTIPNDGDSSIRLDAAEALLERAGYVLDATIRNPTAETIGKAKISVAEAKVLTTGSALQTSTRLFELVGTRSALGTHNLDRFWRDARTHTLHDPVRWKFNAVGNYYLTAPSLRSIRGSNDIKLGVLAHHAE